MSGSLNAVAIIHAAHARVSELGVTVDDSVLSEELRQTSEAVSELIESEKAYDKARSACRANLTTASVRLLGACILRRAAAVARIGGAA